MWMVINMLPAPRINQQMELKEHIRLSFSSSKEMLMSYLLKPSCSSQSPETPLLRFLNQEPRRQFACNICQEVFKSKQGLNQHIGKMHLPVSDGVTCSICQKQFKHKHALKFHERQVHEKSTRADCQLCGKTFYNKYEVKKHQKTKHQL